MKTSYIDRRLVLVGGGHAHVQVIRSLMMNPIKGLQAILVAKEDMAPYSGMLPGYLAGWYSETDIQFDLRRLCEAAGIRFVHDAVAGVDAAKREVRCQDYPELGYDVLSINVGIQPKLPSKETVESLKDPRIIPLKPISQLIPKWTQFLESISKQSSPKVAIIGGGAAGVEVGIATHYRLKGLGKTPEITLVQRSERILKGHPDAARIAFSKRLSEIGIQVDSGRDIQNSAELLRDFDYVFLATDAQAPKWISNSDLPTDSDGFLRVNAELQSVSDPKIFGAGDCVSIEDHSLPRAGVYAVRAGKYLAKNLQATFRSEPLLHYRPQKNVLALITSGDREAIATRGRLAFQTSPKTLWKLKDQIDRKFMDRFSTAPKMEMDTGEPMLCGGCGSKVGSEALQGALEQVLGKETSFKDAAPVKVGEQSLLQSVDYFERLYSDPFVFGKIASLHALNDVWAARGNPRTALAIASVPKSPPAIVEENLRVLLSGAKQVLDEHSVEMVGGHSFQGDHFGFGLSVTGTPRSQSDGKNLDRTGVEFVLNKPLGTGAILAGHKQGVTKGETLRLAIESMLQSNAPALEALKDFDVHSLTDITGFGLAGHLSEVCGQLGKPELRLDPDVSLPGAIELISSGTESSIAPENEKLFVQLMGRLTSSELERLSIDPQTSGGLLAAVPIGQGEKLRQEWRKIGYKNASIVACLE